MQTFSDMAKSLNRLTIYLNEDVLHRLRESLKIRARILAEIATEFPHVRAAVKWATPLAKRI
jgi:hypothetical protein